MKNNALLFLTATVATSCLGAWGYQPIDGLSSPHEQLHFPLNSEQGWFMKESYLLFKPFVRDLEFGIDETYTIPGNVPAGSEEFSQTLKLKRPDFEWSSGARIGIGRYLPNHDKWDISLFTTYLYSVASEEVSASAPNGISPDFVFPSTSSYYDVPSYSSSATWRLNYFTWDLTVGRLFNLPLNTTLHPFGGIRGALIYQSYNVHHQGQTIIDSPYIATMNDRFKARNNFWGVGPKVGTDLIFTFGRSWALLSQFSGSILYGHYSVSETIDYDGTVFDSPLDNTLQAKDNDYVIRSNLEGSIGLGWEKWFKRGTVRVAPSILFETGVWFAMNQLSDFRPTSDLDDFVPVRRHGNLLYSGFTFNLQVDF